MDWTAQRAAAINRAARAAKQGKRSISDKKYEWRALVYHSYCKSMFFFCSTVYATKQRKFVNALNKMYKECEHLEIGV